MSTPYTEYGGRIQLVFKTANEETSPTTA